MFATMLLIYLIGTGSMSIHGGVLLAAIIADAIAWGSISNSFEAWATGTTESQVFWDNEDDS